MPDEFAKSEASQVGFLFLGDCLLRDFYKEVTFKGFTLGMLFLFLRDFP